METQIVDNPIANIADKTVFPVYVHKLGKPMFLSKTRKVIVDEFVRTRNYTSCQTAVKKECGAGLRVSTIKRMLEYPDTQAYIQEIFEDSGYYNSWTKEKWFGVMSRHLSGENRLQNGDLYAMNLIGKFKGWDAPSGIGNISVINFTQSNGQA